MQYSDSSNYGFPSAGLPGCTSSMVNQAELQGDVVDGLSH